MSEPGETFRAHEARCIGAEIGIDWARAPFDIEQFRIGTNVELKPGLHDPRTNVSDDDPRVLTYGGSCVEWLPGEPGPPHSSLSH
jgi:hypothetical protein